MNLFWPVERATLLIPSGPKADQFRPHLFIMLCGPVTEQKLILLASLSSIKPGQYFDPACQILPEETALEFVTKPSFIDYSKLRLKPADAIQRGLDSGELTSIGLIEPELLKRITIGLHCSKRTPKRFRIFANEHGI